MNITLDREGPVPSAEWQEQLDLLASPGGQLSWLHLYWEPGETWEPIHRWFIGQVIPRRSIPPIYLEWLDGPNPRSQGYLEDGRWVSLAPPISKRQWEYYRETGCLLKPYWVIQGRFGGHKYWFNQTEQKILKLKNLDATPYLPGDLPYAELGQNTIARLLQADLMRKFQYTTRYLENTETRLKDEERALLVEMRTRMLDWLTEQSRETADKANHLFRKGLFPDQPELPRTFEAEYEAQEEQIIQGV